MLTALSKPRSSARRRYAPISASDAVRGPRAKLGRRRPNFTGVTVRDLRRLGGWASSRKRSSGRRSLALHLFEGEAADAGVGAAAVGHDEGHEDLAGLGRVGDADLH